MKKLSELLKLRKPVDGLFGIEIECEGEKLPAAVPYQWTIKDDGSLRGRFPDQRAEYVLVLPMRLDDSVQAVKDLRNTMDNAKSKLDFSYRTSVHVHVNVSDLTTDQYLNMVYTYLLLENSMVRYCGQERIANRFCLRLQDAEGFMETLVNLFRSGPSVIGKLNQDALKYASMNIAATPRYGSLEFRAMRGNMEVDYITRWLIALNNIKEFAKKFKTPRHIHDFFVRNEPSKFMEEVLGDVYPFFSYEEEVDDMRLAFSLTIELPYMYEDERARIQRVEKHIEEERKRMLEQVERDILRMKRMELEGIDELDEVAVAFNIRNPMPIADRIVRNNF